MKFIVQRDNDTNEIINAWQSQKQCAEDIGVKAPAIAQAIKLHGRCKGYLFEKVEIPPEVVIDVIKQNA